MSEMITSEYPACFETGMKSLLLNRVGTTAQALRWDGLSSEDSELLWSFGNFLVLYSNREKIIFTLGFVRIDR